MKGNFSLGAVDILRANLRTRKGKLVKDNAVQYTAIQYNKHNTIQYNTIKYNTMQYIVIQYSTAHITIYNNSINSKMVHIK